MVVLPYELVTISAPQCDQVVSAKDFADPIAHAMKGMSGLKDNVY